MGGHVLSHTLPPSRHVLSHTPIFVLLHTRVPLRAAHSAALRNRNARARALTFSSFNGSPCGQVPEGVWTGTRSGMAEQLRSHQREGQTGHARCQPLPFERGVGFAVVDVGSPTRATSVSRTLVGPFGSRAPRRPRRRRTRARWAVPSGLRGCQTDAQILLSGP